MPTQMLEVVQCTRCNSDQQRRNMSPFRGICAQCYDREYGHCVQCETLLHIVGQDVYYLDADRRRTMPLCYSCWGVRRNNLTNHWHPAPLDASIATYKRIRSKRKYGVEVETARCRHFEQLFGKTKFGCKLDCSISGREFYSPILYGDEGFAEIEALLEFGQNWNWSVDLDCGCHTHYDMRDETDIELYHIAYAYMKTYDFWQHSVSNYRRNDNYCHAPNYNRDDIRRNSDRGSTFRDFCHQCDRYDYVNISAYCVHTTFEIRLLEGTVNAETICNWVSLHTRFMDYVKGLSYDDLDHFFAGQPKHVFSALLRIVDETTLTNWLANRISTHSPGTLD